MATDLFNNSSNDYVTPSLPSCPGQSDDMYFEFLPNRQAGVISGSDILMSMDLSDISQIVTSYVEQKQIIQSGEVVYIQGLTKGISYRSQIYPIDGSVTYTDDTHSEDMMYMSVDFSINYYKSFRYYESNIFATSDETLGIDIASAINIALGNAGISVTASYDPSMFTFTGNTAGYSFNVTAMDVSLFVPDTSIVGNPIYEDVSSGVPAFKYPNGAMLGYILKATYPSSVTDESLKYININHVPDTLTYYEVSTGDTNAYVKYTKTVDVGMNGTSNSTTISAGDYLNYIDVNQKWEKVGVLRSWISASDPENSNVENLITGFYVYNPQTTAVQIEYMLIL